MPFSVVVQGECVEGPNPEPASFLIRLLVTVEYRKMSTRTKLMVLMEILAQSKVKRDIYSQNELCLEHFGKKCIVNHYGNSNMFDFHFGCF